MARNKHPEETVQRILTTASKLFLEKGYEKTSLQDIIRETGLSKGHPGWNTRLMAPSKKIFIASQVYSSSAAPRKWCRTWAFCLNPFSLYRSNDSK